MEFNLKVYVLKKLQALHVYWFTLFHSVYKFGIQKTNFHKKLHFTTKNNNYLSQKYKQISLLNLRFVKFLLVFIGTGQYKNIEGLEIWVK